jgi:hypothetical protein
MGGESFSSAGTDAALAHRCMRDDPERASSWGRQKAPHRGDGWGEMAGTLWYLQGTSLAPPVHALQGEGQAPGAKVACGFSWS